LTKSAAGGKMEILGRADRTRPSQTIVIKTSVILFIKKQAVGTGPVSAC
jgi:hypothetical protein